MTIEEADELMENFQKWDNKHAKQEFLHRMERKLGRKHRYQRR